MPELLLELLSEEIPARMQAKAADDLKRLVCEGLKKAGLEFESAEAFVTPRRLALVVDGLPEKQPDVTEEKRGPRVGSPEKAVRGFLKSVGMTLDEVERRKTEKGEFYFAVISEPGNDTKEILEKVINSSVQELPWPKSMRWLRTEITKSLLFTHKRTFKWVRPLRHVLGIFNGQSLEGWVWTVGGLLSGDHLSFTNETFGHWILAPDKFSVENFEEYKQKLRDAYVIVDQQERQEIISSDIKKIIAAENLQLQDDPGLLDEVTGLVEWPVVLMGSIGKAFMDLPPEVLTTVMRHHQKYFALVDRKGKLAPKFIVVANTETRDHGKAVIAGNERVLRARLADAKFFWDQDRMRPLNSRIQELGGRVFHAKLGTVLDKVLRIEQLAGELAAHCAADKDDAGRAASLCKADLSTEMVTEFTELQGVMGRYYALHDGEKPEVAAAVAEHYSPLGPNDSCPSAPLSVAVALADKIDSLVGFWAIDEKPTGSKDPYALRRAALGVIRLIVENGLRLALVDAFGKAEKNFNKTLGGVSDTLDTDDLLAFFADRLKVHLRGKDVPHDHIDAVFALGGEDDLMRLLARVDALGAFLKTNDGGNLLTAYKRAANIVRIEEKNDSKRYGSEVDEKLLELKEEKSLHKELKSTAPNIAQALKDEDFHAAMGLLAGLRKPVDDFFDHVTVNCEEEELRENRLRLLSEISSAMDNVADFSKIEGGER